MQPTQPSMPSSSTVSKTERSPKPPAPSASRHSPSLSRRHPSPHVVVSHPTVDADHEDFSRRLRISSSPSPRPLQHKSIASSKLYNPGTDPIPVRRTLEPDAMSDDTGSSYAPRGAASHTHRDDRSNAARQLFDHRKDDPVRFSVLARPQPGRPSPTPKSSGDYVSASSTSSYAASISSSTFTLSSTTDGSSASSALFDGRPGQGTEDSGNNVFSLQLKKLYRNISSLENKIKQEDSMEETDDLQTSRVLLKGKEVESGDLEKEKWKKQIEDHKQWVFEPLILPFH
jgi:protein SMG6